MCRTRWTQAVVDALSRRWRGTLGWKSVGAAGMQQALCGRIVEPAGPGATTCLAPRWPAAHAKRTRQDGRWEVQCHATCSCQQYAMLYGCLSASVVRVQMLAIASHSTLHHTHVPSCGSCLSPHPELRCRARHFTSQHLSASSFSTLSHAAGCRLELGGVAQLLTIRRDWLTGEHSTRAPVIPPAYPHTNPRGHSRALCGSCAPPPPSPPQ